MSVVQRVFMSGKVQNIGLRDWVVRQAVEHGLTGWVRYLRDGRVEMLVAGEDEAVQAMIALCRVGPPQARVDHVDVQAATERAPKGFTKRFTA